MLLITGADGFVGNALCEALHRQNQLVRAAVRLSGSLDPSFPSNSELVSIGSISDHTEWASRLKGVVTIIHLAARTHVMHEESPDAFAAYRAVNVAGTEKLARDAAAAGVRRLVFLSSIKVNGERTPDGPFTENDMPRPEDAYGISKWEAEQALWKIAADTRLEVVVLRAPLVYGAGVKGNFLRLMNMVARGWPLPLASVRNKRSLVYLGNLVDVLIAAAQSPAAAGHTYLVSDGEDMSTPSLIRGIAKALDVPPRLFALPVPLLRAGGTLLGKGGEAMRLTGSLQIDSSKIRRELGWQPPFSVVQGLEETGRWYRKAVSGKR